MRKQPSGGPPSVEAKKRDNIITEVREYEVITPLFGGGALPAEADAVTVVRGTEVRGQLRFWWRAIRGWQSNGKMEELKQLEDAIWGAAHIHEKEKDATEKKQEADKIEPVQLAVEVVQAGVEKVAFFSNGKPNPDAKIHPYAAFPLQPTEEERRKRIYTEKKVRLNVRFKVIVTYYKDHADEVGAALWAWETFGGIGGRTRRGFGALKLIKAYEKGEAGKDIPVTVELPPSIGTERWLLEKLSQYIKEGLFATDIPHLSANLQLRITNSFSRPEEAWDFLIRRLMSFRQGLEGRNRKKVWPEADAIRVWQGDKRNAIQKFPRAAFGLPIIFHFKDGYPKDTTLQGSEKEMTRMASPLILRPLACRDGKAVGLAIVLEGITLPPENVALDGKAVKTGLTPQEARNIEPMRRQNETDVLKAFMKYLGGK